MDTLKMVFVRIFSILFSFMKKVQTRNKQYINKKLSLPGDIIMYTLEDLVMGKKYSTFSDSFCLILSSGIYNKHLCRINLTMCCSKFCYSSVHKK